MMNHRKKTVNCIEMAEIRVKGGRAGGLGEETSGGLHKSKALESLIDSY